MSSRKDEKAIEKLRKKEEKEAKKLAKSDNKSVRRAKSDGVRLTENKFIRKFQSEGAAAASYDAARDSGPAVLRPVLEAGQQFLKDGTALCKFSVKRGMLQSIFRVDFASMQIVWLQGKQTKRIHLEQVKEVRRCEEALKCKVFRNSSDASQAAVEFALVVVYGTEFKLQQLCLAVPEQEDGPKARLEAFAAWTDGLLRLTTACAPELYGPECQLEHWMQREWAMMCSDLKGPGLRDIKAWLQRISCKLTNSETKELFSKVDRSRRGYLTENEFRQLYWDAADTVGAIFQSVIRDPKAKARKEVSSADLQIFLRDKQGEQATLEHCDDIARRYSGPDKRFRLANLVAYLHGAENGAFSPEHRLTVYQPMDRPLAHYFVNTSHNTYLFGNQWKSESSFEAYIKCLEDGCRCVEIDTWDNLRAEDPYDQIVVTHGNTLTTKIKFRDVVPAIMAHAFTASPYPVILSIEQHCGLDQQARMAEIFVKELGAALITGPLPECSDPDRNCYPSPEQLKHRIIIKAKKLEHGRSDVACSSNADTEDISLAVLTGDLRLEDKVDGSWTKHFFSLYKTKITYTEISSDDRVGEDEEADDEEDVDDSTIEVDQPDDDKELHHEEPWFHGKLEGGRHAAAALLESAVTDLPPDRRNGTFLVRESDTSEGFVVSVWCEDPDQEKGVRHCRIRYAEGLFFLNNIISFETLYELIEYYRQNPVQSVQFHVLLTDAVPQLAAHETQQWWHGKGCTRQIADELLRQFNTNGVFLVRPSESTGNSFAISFRAEGIVRHCRVRKEGRLYSIGESEFESLVALIENYETAPLYKNTRLTDPIDSTRRDRPILHNQESRTCRTLYEYSAQHPDELSFAANVIISNVQKREENWWSGDFGGMEGGWFPKNYAEEVDTKRAQVILAEQTAVANTLDAAAMDVDGLHVEPRPSKPHQRLIFRIVNHKQNQFLDVGADDEDQMKLWAKLIDETATKYNEQSQSVEVLQRKMKIAKELSDLVYYCYSVPFRDFDTSKSVPYNAMSSWNEKKAAAVCAQRGLNANPKGFNAYNQRQISRVYPQGRRLDSSNFDPQQMWNCGIQLVALNFQTPGAPMWLNNGKFRQNGNCGYLLKPAVLVDPSIPFNPHSPSTFRPHVDPLTLTVTILSARHLKKTKKKAGGKSGGKGRLVSPFVELELAGVPSDARRFKTRTISDNGFNPVWDERFQFNVDFPEMACLSLVVYDEDTFGDAVVVGQSVIPIGSKDSPTLLSGWRSVQVYNTYSSEMPVTSVLIHVTKKFNPRGNNAPRRQQRLSSVDAVREVSAPVATSVPLSKHEPMQAL